MNVVFMTLNGPTLPDTIDYFGGLGAPAVHVMQMLDGNGESDHLNPLLHLPPEYVESIKQRCIEVVRRRSMFLVWDVMGVEEYDFRRAKIARKPRSADYGDWDWRMNLYFPGYCKFVRDRVRVTVDGSVAPCSYSTDGELELGSLADQDFEAMWNGPKMRDLRRAHLTADYPTICKSCRFSDPRIPAMEAAQFQGDVLGNTAPDTDFVVPELEILEPAHTTRQFDAPAIRIRRPQRGFGEYLLVLGLGAAQRDFMCSLEPTLDGESIVFEIPSRVWSKLQPNRGYWWWLFASDVEGGLRCSTSTEIRCVVRHEPIPRIEGSGLRYPDEGHLPVVDLGSAKTNGNGNGRSLLPPRPRLGRRRGKTAFDGPRRFVTTRP
jgi:radical SAM protein with 4Fe4S-binding SPASM domain